MDLFIIFGIELIVLFILKLLVDLSLDKDKKEAYTMMENFENIRKSKNVNQDEFIEKCLKIITTIEPLVWNGFRVKNSKHGKGWFVEGDYFDEKRFWPSKDTFGNKYYPDSYLSKDMAEKELLNVLERLVGSIIYFENLSIEFNEKRED